MVLCSHIITLVPIGIHRTGTDTIRRENPVRNNIPDGRLPSNTKRRSCMDCLRKPSSLPHNFFP